MRSFCTDAIRYLIKTSRVTIKQLHGITCKRGGKERGKESEINLELNVLVAKSDGMSTISRTHMLEGEN